MTTDPRLTEERIRSWLDGQQLARERMCLQVLSLDRRFSHVRPRQPKGGPDGGCDLEATFHDGRRAVGAIGFRNSPNDGAADTRWVRSKFKSDLERSREAAGEFDVFVFLTNVKLTVKARQRLLELGRELGAPVVEVFDREQIRVSLDSPEGLAARYQFLQIPMSDAEQAAFFSRWGSDLEGLVSRSFAEVDDRLRRLEFLHEREGPLASLVFILYLKDSATIADLPHVRALLSIGRLTRDFARSQWHIGVCNNSPGRAVESCGSGPCLAGAFWLHDGSTPLSTSASTWRDPFSMVSAHGGFSEFDDPNIVSTLSDLDEGMFGFSMNRQLFNRLASITVYANEYAIWSATASELSADTPNAEPKTPWVFDAAELEDPWVRVLPKDFSGTFHFSSTTPRRVRLARQLPRAP
jgi:hypothetical protein